eukprot:CAMPEP_0170486910 /NCGR_PEP_ID=MMETSP0208-20121228/5820_1 /TAXON_ID=197538 /ORGANISM="Strombidium inclinatum, Strain S3" /LENGTH=39 /DNA_ID= /DNA_START= /DNA_END= /DNA_ORIENTATION=
MTKSENSVSLVRCCNTKKIKQEKKDEELEAENTDKKKED